MKKSFMSISMLVVSISMLALFLCSSVANAQQASSKFIYNKDGNTETIYTLDETGKFLTPKLKYVYNKDEKSKSGLKKAYRWNSSEQKWIPYYLITMFETDNNSVVEYAAWDSKTCEFSLNFQKAIYNKGFENDILSFIYYKWNPELNNWEVDQHLLLGHYLAGNVGRVN